MPENPESILSVGLLAAGAIAAIGLVAFATYAAFFQKH